MTCLFGGFAIAAFAFASVGSVSSAPAKETSAPAGTPVRMKYMDDYGGTELKGTDSVRLLLNSSTKTTISQRYEFTISMNESASNQYILGYYGEGELNLPLTFYYTVTKADGNQVEEHTVQTKKSSNALYDAIGSKIGNDVNGQQYFSSSLNILLDSPDDTIDPESVYATNIFKAVQDPDSKLWVPSEKPSEKYYLSGPRIRFDSTTSFNDIMQISLKEISTFEDKIAFRCRYTMDGASETLKNAIDPVDYEDFSRDVAAGIDGIRYRFHSFNTSYYEIRFNDGTSAKFPVQYETGNGTSWITLDPNGGELVFMADRQSSYFTGKLNLGDISDIWLDNVTVRLEFYVLETGKSANARKGTRTYYFGMIDTNPQKASVAKTSYVLVMWVAALLTGVIFAGLGTGLYFYRKNRYKNDEFLRVDTKQFLKQAGIFFIVVESLAMEITSIVIRFGNFNNSTVVQNPVDKYVIIFALASILSIGYLIKWSISAFKIRSERRKTEKLHLNELANDDGTVNLNELEKREDEKKEEEKTPKKAA